MNILKYKFLISCLILFPLIFLIYAKVTHPIYESSGSVTIFRTKIENPHFINPEIRNRWAWVRDGLSLKANILGHDFLKTLVENNVTLKGRLDSFVEKNKVKGEKEDLNFLFLERLKKKIRIDYTGGDENSYIFKVKDKDKKLPKYIVTKLIERVKYLYIGQFNNVFKDSLENLDRAFPSKEEVKKIKDLIKVSMVLENSQENFKFQITKYPFISLGPIWPNKKLLLLVGIFFGALIGVFIEYFNKNETAPV